MRFTALAAALGALASGACACTGAGRAPSPVFASPTVIAGSSAPRGADPMPPEEAGQVPAGAPAPAPPKARSGARSGARTDARPGARPDVPSNARSGSRSATHRSGAQSDTRSDDRSATRRSDARSDGRSTTQQSDSVSDGRSVTQRSDSISDDQRKDQPKTSIRAVSAAPIRVVSATRAPTSSRDADGSDTPKPDRRADAEPDRRADAEPDRRADAEPDRRPASKPDRRADAEPARRPGADVEPAARHADAEPTDRRADTEPAARRADSDADADRREDDDDAPGRRRARADADADAEPARKPERPALRAPHRAIELLPPKLRTLADLRELIGRRDARDSFAAVAAWSRTLGAPVAATSGAELVSWAAEARRLYPATEPPRPGDLLVFDQATSDDASDLVALVLECDERGVAELIYLGAGVVRRGLVDASRPAVHRDARGATVNTYLRHGRRWPGKGMHYLAGELLAHVVRPR